MSLAKTAKARAAMANRDEALSAQARQILVMCDGKRRLRELEALLGAECVAVIQQLIADGYLQESISPPATPQTAPAAEVRSRRSIAATKMYMIDMLQLLRNVEASSLAVSLHTSADEHELVRTVQAALRFIREASGETYALRVYQRVIETVPEPHLPGLRSLGKELFPQGSVPA